MGVYKLQTGLDVIFRLKFPKVRVHSGNSRAASIPSDLVVPVLWLLGHSVSCRGYFLDMMPRCWLFRDFAGLRCMTVIPSRVHFFIISLSIPQNLTVSGMGTSNRDSF
jgi:hypothetical protein